MLGEEVGGLFDRNVEEIFEFGFIFSEVKIEVFMFYLIFIYFFK